MPRPGRKAFRTEGLTGNPSLLERNQKIREENERFISKLFGGPGLSTNELKDFVAGIKRYNRLITLEDKMDKTLEEARLNRMRRELRKRSVQ